MENVIHECFDFVEALLNKQADELQKLKSSNSDLRKELLEKSAKLDEFEISKEASQIKKSSSNSWGKLESNSNLNRDDLKGKSQADINLYKRLGYI